MTMTKEEKKAANAIYRAKNRERILAEKAKYRAKHRERLRAYSRAFSAANRELRSINNAIYYDLTAEQQRENSNRRYAEQHPAVLAKRQARAEAEARRHAIQAAPLTAAQQRELYGHVVAIIPAGLATDTRLDLISRIFLAVHDGKFPCPPKPENARTMLRAIDREAFNPEIVSLDAIVHSGASRGQLMGIY